MSESEFREIEATELSAESGLVEKDSQLEPLVCRTCLQPREPLVNEGGLLFCQPCLKNYRQIMDWMNPQLDTGQTPCYKRALELRATAQLRIAARSYKITEADLDEAVQAELKESGFENYPLHNLSQYPPRRIIEAVRWARKLLDKRQ